MRRLITVLAAVVLAALAGGGTLTGRPGAQEIAAPAAGLAVATFAGGCFWCMEGPFDKLSGVVSTTSGYTGGRVANPSYAQVSAGGTGHAEAVEVRYDPAQVSFETLLDVFWRNVDPFDGAGQFCDRGSQYRPAIFVHDAEQSRLAEASKARIAARFKEPLAVAIETATAFYPAEAYHQDYYLTNPLKYTYYRYACGRDQRLERIWGEKHTG